METFKFKSAGHDEEKDTGNVAMFGNSVGDLEHLAKFSWYYLPNIAIGGLEVLSIAFLLLILYDYIPVNYLIYILAPIASSYFLASVASSKRMSSPDAPSNCSDYLRQCLKCVSLMRFSILLSVFSAKCVLIYVYSENLTAVVSPFRSLSALANISVDQLPSVMIPTKYVSMSLWCIFFTWFVESCFLLGRMPLNLDSKSLIYASLLSFVDTLGTSIFFWYHRWNVRQNELLHFHNIITTLPMLFMAVASARCLVWISTLWLFEKPEDKCCLPFIGMVHVCVAAATVVVYMLTDSRTLFSLKMICIIAMAERLLMTGISEYLSYLKRKTVKDSKRRRSGNNLPADPSVAGDADPDVDQPLLSHGSPQGSHVSLSGSKSRGGDDSEMLQQAARNEAMEASASQLEQGRGRRVPTEASAAARANEGERGRQQEEEEILRDLEKQRVIILRNQHAVDLEFLKLKSFQISELVGRLQRERLGPLKTDLAALEANPGEDNSSAIQQKMEEMKELQATIDSKTEEFRELIRRQEQTQRDYDILDRTVSELN